MEMGSLHSASSGFDGITPDQAPILDQAGPDPIWHVDLVEQVLRYFQQWAPAWRS